MKLPVLAVALLLTLGACITGFSQERTQKNEPDKLAAQEAKEKDIRRLLQLMNAGEAGVQIMDQLFDTLRNTSSQVPQSVWDELVEETRSEFRSEKLIEMNVPIYSKHYTHDEIKAQISFYESPIGRKVVEQTPLIIKEAIDVGIEHGRKVLQRLNEKLKSKG